MQKDRFVFAVIIYGVILLAAAGFCSFLLPGDLSAVANSEVSVEKEEQSQPDGNEPTQALAPTKNPEQGQPPKDAEDEPSGAWAELRAETTKEWRTIIGETCIVLPKPESVTTEKELSFTLTEMPVERSIALQIQGCAYTEYSYADIERLAEGEYFNANPEEKEPLGAMTQICTQQEDGSYELYVELLLDKTYVYNVYETEKHYFIALREAKSVYDSIVVLDAGHGGWDTGTLSADGKEYEKNINLQVLIYLEELLTARQYKVYTTRTTDRYIGHGERIALANALEADMFISIHCSNVYQDAEANGTEVLYAEQELTGSTKLKAKVLAQICAEKLTETMPSENGAVWVPDEEVTVLQEAEVPAVQVELDMELLQTEDGQRAAAQALCDAVLEAYHASLPE